MTDETATAADTAAPERTGGWKGHRKRNNAPRLERDEARRQGEIVTLAFTLLGGKEAAMAFLNVTSKDLKARPIDLAINSELGFMRVETLLRKLGQRPGEAKAPA